MKSSINTLGASNLSETQRANLDFYSTDPSAVNDLLQKMPELAECKRVLEPCAGVGSISDRFQFLTGIKVDCYDILSRRDDIIQMNYMYLDCAGVYDLILTNFPSKSSTAKNPIGFSELLIKALKDVAPDGYVCSFQRLLSLESKKRYEQVYSKYKPEKIYVYSHRMQCYADGDMSKKINSSIAYAWFIYHKGLDGKFSQETKLDWIY